MPALAPVVLLAACVPPGVDDVQIGSIAAAPEPPEPAPVAEQVDVVETPSWSPAIVKRNGREISTYTYVVQPGDSMFAVASKTGAGATVIANANGLDPPLYTLRAGMRLQIPGGLYHSVGSGETGIAIARAYNVVWADIVALNALEPPFTLQVGQNLLLSSDPSVGAQRGHLIPEMRAAAFTLNIDDIVTGGQPAAISPPKLASRWAFAGRFVWPVEGSVIRRFGSQGGGRVNDGLNIAALTGASVRSAAAGTVVYSGNEIGLFGGLVLIDHGSGWVTAYAHLGKLAVARGDKVASSQHLGSVGDTGYVTRPQLHFEIRKDRRPVDPMTKLPAR